MSEKHELEGTVLLADDTDSLRTSTARLLALMGLAVTSVADGTTVSALLEERDFDVLVLDWTMAPGGEEIVRRAREARPDLAIVVVSGYGLEAVALEIDARTTFLEKPFRVEQLKAALRGVLAGRTSRGAPAPSG